MKWDIQIKGNSIGGRQGFAYIGNSMKYAVLKADIDKEHEHKDFQQFGKVRVAYTYNNRESFITADLEVEKGHWTLGCGGTCLHSAFGFTDMMECVENANCPIVRQGDVVAVAIISNHFKMCLINLFKVGRIDANCMTVATLTPLNDEEMEEIKADALKWCNRF